MRVVIQVEKLYEQLKTISARKCEYKTRDPWTSTCVLQASEQFSSERTNPEIV